MPLTSLRDISIAFGDTQILDCAELFIDRGERIGLVGRNGEGKSTLLKIIGLQIVPDQGEVRLPAGNRTALLDQNPDITSHTNVYEFVAAGLGDIGTILATYQKLLNSSGQNAETIEKIYALQDQLTNQDGWKYQSSLDYTIGKLGLSPEQRLSELSGGWLRRASLAQAMVSKPDILLLDEPTNHLDIPSIVWLEKELLKFEGAVMFVTHDREFLDRIATRIVELDRGILTTWPGNHNDYVLRKAASLESEQRQNAVFDKKLDKEEEWIREGIKARRRRNEGRVRSLLKMRQQRAQRRNRQNSVKLEIEQDAPSGKRVIEVNNISYRIGTIDIIREFSTSIVRGDRIGLIGPNGIGKTTLLRLLLKEIQPDAGTVRHGTGISVANFDQFRSELDPKKTIVEVIGEGREFITINNKPRHVMSYLSNFLFSSRRARSPLASLSGGEKARILLARLFSKPANLLIMDEPTNDLDTETLELLEELLLAYEGTLLLVSHDRRFMDNVVTSTLCFEGEAKINEFVGGYSDWLRKSTAPVYDKSSVNKSTPADSGARATRSGGTGKRKPGYRQQQELNRLPGKIEAIELQQQGLVQLLSSDNLYKNNDNNVRDVSNELAAIEGDLEQLYKRWTELESLYDTREN